jgi:hypothetical protein
MVITNVERVTQSVADEIEAGYGDGDGGAGMIASQGALEHVAPAGQRRLNAITKEADIGLQENSMRNRQSSP